jgi:hypothetical protein
MADALDSKSSVRKDVRVQVPPSVLLISCRIAAVLPQLFKLGLPLADYLPKQLRDLDELRTALPKIAKDRKFTAQIEAAVRDNSSDDGK